MRAQAGDLEGARRAWEKALEVHPGDPQARANLDRLTATSPPAPR
jgi:Flp pilus assembly protein TadD